MVKTKFKKAVSLMLAAVMSLTAFTGIGATTAFAAVGEKADVYLVDYPRSGDTNNNGEWGHGNLNYMNGWKGLSTKYTGLRAMGSYSGNIAYCIEPGTGQRTGDTLTEKDENFFNNISPNGTISGDDIRLLIGRILQYGYRGGISTSWKSQNESDANCIAHAYATQILIWETIVGERDAGFNHVSTSGYNAVLECVSTAHPLRSKILSYYNSMVTSVQNHTKVPSFCTRSSGSAKVNELEWNGSKYVATLTDTNGVLGNYNFSANIDGVSFSVSGNKLTVSMEKAPSKEFTITAAKKNGVRRGVVVWSDGIHQNGNGIQDVVTYAQEVSDPVSGFVKMKVSYGSCQIVKTSEDGKVDGIQFKDIIRVFPRTLSNTNTSLVLKTPKTKTSVRKIFLPSTVAQMLLERKKQIDEMKELFGDEYLDYDLVFCHSSGRPMEGQVINRALKKLIQDNDLPDVVFHSFRHASITYKLKWNGGDMKSVQGDSGHARMDMVADVYSHIIDEDRRYNAQKFEEQFYNAKGLKNAEEGKTAPMPKFETSVELLDPMAEVQKESEVEKEKPAENSTDENAALLTKLLSNPETAALLKALAKTI